MPEEPSPLKRVVAHRGPTISLGAATLGIVCLELVLPLTVLQTYDRFVPNVSQASLTVFFCIATVCLIAEAGLRWARSVLLNLSGTSFAHQTGCAVMERLLTSQQGGGYGTGANLALLGTVRSMREMTDTRWLVSIAELSLIPLAFCLIALIAGPLVFVPLILTIGFALISFRIGKQLEAARNVRLDRDTARFDNMVEMLRGLGTVKALSMEARMQRRYDAAKYYSTLAHLAVVRTITRLFDATASFGTFLVMCLILAGAVLTVNGQITAGAMIAAVILSGRCMPPIQKGLSLLTRRQEFIVERRQVEARLAELDAKAAPLGTVETENEGQFAVEDLTLYHDERAFLEGAQIAFPTKEITWLDCDDYARLGRMFRVLAGIEAPDEGRVLLNGADQRQISGHLRARQIALLQSDTVLYRGTIMDNISRFGAVSLSDVLFIARHLQLDRDLAALPRGYDTMLRGDGADPLPPGLRHRIALARALAPRPRVVLFNHADAGLDQQSYSALIDLLGKLQGHATVILASADANLQGLARHHVSLINGKFSASVVQGSRNLSVARYRELRI